MKLVEDSPKNYHCINRNNVPSLAVGMPVKIHYMHQQYVLHKFWLKYSLEADLCFYLLPTQNPL